MVGGSASSSPVLSKRFNEHDSSDTVLLSDLVLVTTAAEMRFSEKEAFVVV